MLWCFAISGAILNYSSSSDFNYTKGKLLAIEQTEQDIKDRLGIKKIGTSYQVQLLLNSSKTTFYIDNNFAESHSSYVDQIKSSKSIEIWSDGDILDDGRERIYKMKGDGRTIIPFVSTKEVYIEKSQMAFYMALFSSLFVLIVLRPKWFLKIIQKSEDEDESLLSFYLEKFKSRNIEELENIVNKTSDFHPDAVEAAKQTLKNH